MWLIDLLGNPWFGGISFIVGPAVIILLARRRKRLEAAAEAARKGTARPAQPAPATPRPAAAVKSSPGIAGMTVLPTGFRGLAWGSAPAADMVVVHRSDGQAFLARAADELKIGPVPVHSIVYAFVNGALQAAIVEMQGGAFDALVRHLTGEWGPPRVGKDGGRCVWVDSRSGQEASQAVLERRAETRTAKLVVSSKAMTGSASRSAVPAAG